MKTRANKDAIMVQKGYLEVGLFPIMVLGYCLYDMGSFLLLVIYFNLLRMKYILNLRSRRSWVNINRAIEA